MNFSDKPILPFLKSEISNFKFGIFSCVEAWDLELLWSLDLGAWIFSIEARQC
jgi:hypothetical protein